MGGPHTQKYQSLHHDLIVLYIFVTVVVSGIPLFHAIPYGAGLDSANNWMYLCKYQMVSPNELPRSVHDNSQSGSRRLLFIVRVLDAAIYVWVPQINIVILATAARTTVREKAIT